MEYRLYRKLEQFGQGCPEDDSETWNESASFIVVREDEYDRFEEEMADDYGNQDYSYRVAYRLLVVIDNLDEMKQIQNVVSDCIVSEECEETETSEDECVDNIVGSSENEAIKGILDKIKSGEEIPKDKIAELFNLIKVRDPSQ